MKGGLLRRVIHGVTLALVAVCAVGGFLGLRAFVWRQDYLVVAMFQSGLVISLIAAGVIAVGYVVLGSLLLSIDWLSVQFGALLGALLYGGYNAITPLTPLSMNETPAWRALQGGVDGVWIGALLGVATLFISARALRLGRGGLTRFLLLYVTVILMAWLILLMQQVAHLPDAVGLVIALPLLGVLRLAVGWLDRRVDSSHYRDYGYDEGG